MVIVKTPKNTLDVQVLVNNEPLAMSKVEGTMKFRTVKDQTPLATTFCIGTVDKSTATTGAFQYSHSWLFHKPLGDKEACLVYLLGPTVTELEPVTVQKSTFPIIRPALLKKVLIQDARFNFAQELLQRSDFLLGQLNQLRSHLLLSHAAKHGALVHYYPSAFNNAALPRNFLHSLFTNRTKSQADHISSPAEPIMATIHSNRSC